MARLMLDIKETEEDPSLGFSCHQDAEDPLQLNALIFGDSGKNYENGFFRLKLNFSEDYPFEPPVVKFDSEIFHPNIDTAGNIDLDLLEKHSWLPSYSLASIITSIKSLLSEPHPSWPHPANPEATDLFLENRSQYEAKVKAIVDQTFHDAGKLLPKVEEETAKKH